MLRLFLSGLALIGSSAQTFSETASSSMSVSPSRLPSRSSSASSSPDPSSTPSPQPTVCALMAPSGIVDNNNGGLTSAGYTISYLIDPPPPVGQLPPNPYWNPLPRSTYQMTLSFVEPNPIYYCDWWAANTAVHSPTGMAFYTAPSGTLLYATPSTTSSMRDVSYTFPFTSNPNVSSIYVTIYKSTSNQARSYYLSCYTCMIASMTPSGTQSASYSSSFTSSSSQTRSTTPSSSLSSSFTGTTTQTRSSSTSITLAASSSSSSSISLTVSASTSPSSSVTGTLSHSSSYSLTSSETLSVSVTNSRSSSTTLSPSFSTSMSISSAGSFSPLPQSFQQVNNISTTMSATTTPQFYTTSFPTLTPTYSPTQNATLPIIVVDGQATNMTTTNALIGTVLALLIVGVALVAGRYIPAKWTEKLRRAVPQSTIDKFKNDPLGSVTALVNDPKSILKDIQIPDSVNSIAKFVPTSVQNLIASSTATAPVDHVSKAATITEDSGVVVVAPQPSTTLHVNTEDVAAVKAFLEARTAENKVIS